MNSTTFGVHHCLDHYSYFWAHNQRIPTYGKIPHLHPSNQNKLTIRAIQNWVNQLNLQNDINRAKSIVQCPNNELMVE